MKIKSLSRSLDSHAPAALGAPAPVSRNLDPSLHPFAQAREYTRALNAVKVDRIFAKPFVGALEGHTDGVYVLEMDPERGNLVASGAGDGGELNQRLEGKEVTRLTISSSSLWTTRNPTVASPYPVTSTSHTESSQQYSPIPLHITSDLCPFAEWTWYQEAAKLRDRSNNQALGRKSGCWQTRR